MMGDTFDLERKFFLTLSNGLGLLIIAAWILALTLPSSGITARLIFGTAILGLFAFTLRKSYHSVNEIKVLDDCIVFNPIGFTIPFSEIKSVDIRSDRNGHIYDVNILSHERGFHWIPIALLWVGNDIRINMFGAGVPSMLSALAKKHAQYQAR